MCKQKRCDHHSQLYCMWLTHWMNVRERDYKCPNGCVVMVHRNGKYVPAESSLVDHVLSPGFVCHRCGVYFLPDDLPIDVLQEMYEYSLERGVFGSRTPAMVRREFKQYAALLKEPVTAAA